MGKGFALLSLVIDFELICNNNSGYGKLVFAIQIFYDKLLSHMKILKIVLVAIFLLSAMPIGGFCDYAHSQDATHHCTLECHALCCQAALPNNAFSFNLPVQATFLSIHENTSLEDPVLSTSKRPPIVLS